MRLTFVAVGRRRLSWEVANDVARTGRFDRGAASEAIYRAMNVLRALAHDLDANPEGPAFVCVGFSDDRDDIDGWGGAAPLDEVMAKRPAGRYYRIIVIDVAMAARRIRARARKHGIALRN